MLIKPIVTEKSTLGVKLNKFYTFLVKKKYNKIEIKNSLIDIYKVKIESIKTINSYPKKKKKMLKKGKWIYCKPNRIKKAIVKIESDKQIEFKLKLD